MHIETATPASQQSAQLNVAAPTISLKSQRIPALDFTKGTLVLLMVLYHWANYFLHPPDKFYDYLRFLTPSFIFITGFMVSHVYLSKYKASDPRLSRRLFTRGVKLLAVFIALNLARNLTLPLLGTGAPARGIPFLSSIFAVFVSGNFPIVGGKLISFSILVPISYLLMLSGMFMLPYRRYKYTFHVACMLLLLSILSLAIFGMRVYNLEFVTIGLVGLLAGFLPIGTINDTGRHPYLLTLAYACYLIAISIWNISFLLLVGGVFLTLIIIYLIGTCTNEGGSVNREFILLGKYSLFGYISQIAILQTLHVGLRRFDFEFVVLAVSLLSAFALTILSVEVVDRARVLNARVDRMYKAVFA